MLESLGISPEAQACYSRLFALRTATVEELTQDGQEPVGRALLEHLEDLSLATQIDEDHWQAIPLPEAVRVLRARRAAELDAAILAADALHLRLIASNDDGSDGLLSVVGNTGAKEAMNEICGAAKQSICAFDKPPYVTTRPPTREWLESYSPEYRALGRGVDVRGVYHPGFDENRLKEMSIFIRHGERARTGDVPMKLVIVDSEVAMIPAPTSYTADQEIRATLVRHPILVEALQSLFDSVWDRSVTIVAAEEGRVVRDPRRGALVNLLMTGATDVAIASQLGVTERSVRRWVAELMDELEVRTRLQLGAALARSNVIQKDTRSLDPNRQTWSA